MPEGEHRGVEVSTSSREGKATQRGTRLAAVSYLGLTVPHSSERHAALGAFYATPRSPTTSSLFLTGHGA